MQFPITIGLRRSFLGAVGLAGAYGLAALAVLATPWQSWLQGALLFGVAGCGAFAWGLRRPRATGLRLLGDGRIECQLAGRPDFQAAELMPGASVHPWLTVLRLKLPERVVAVVVLPDSTTQDQFRRLRVWLRWRGEFSAGEGGA